jgi:DEAD/DEAH box helicase domain-containing protein
VEWVYEATISQLRSSEKTSHLVSRIESYRGGYSADARRSIEERFFRGDLWGVGESWLLASCIIGGLYRASNIYICISSSVGTNALELGVDVGNIHLTLHCGYPGSKSSLLQQAGRSGRGTGMPSCSVVVSFSSPSEQALWKAPTNVLKTGVDVRPSLPISGRVLQGHLLCAGEEFPLTDDRPVSCLLNETAGDGSFCPPDKALFGDEAYQDGVEQLIQKSLMRNKVVCAVNSTTDAQVVEEIICRETHPVSVFE